MTDEPVTVESLLAELVDEVRALRADMRRQQGREARDLEELVDALEGHLGQKDFSASSLGTLVREEPYCAVVLALEKVVELTVDTWPMRLGRMLANHPRVEVLRKVNNAAMFRIRDFG